MAASVFDSTLYARLFSTAQVGRLFTDSAEVRAMLLVEGALAKAQGALGVIPELSGAAIHRASLEVQLDPGALAAATGKNGVPIPGLVDLFRSEMQAPEHAAYVHWGATSQDIMDTALMLRLRQALSLIEADVRSVLKALAEHASTHAETPMPARTYGQHATPTSWGAICAAWGAPLLNALNELDDLRASSLFVSLSGAAGTSSALGDKADETRAALAQALGLNDPHRSWHTDRTPVLRIVDWMMRVQAALGAMGQSLVALSASGIDEVQFSVAGGSSTMPQKSNPVAASTLVALSHQATGLRAALQSAAQHQHQRDGAAWFTEWMVLPQLGLCAAAALTQAKTLCANLGINHTNMHDHLGGLGLIHAEALSFALAAHMPRPDAQAATKALCAQAQERGVTLGELALKAYPDLPKSIFEPARQMGQAPNSARAFAALVSSI